jgi:hypothetical protein
MGEQRKLASLPPLRLGRITRVAFGVATLLVIPFVGLETLTGWGVAPLLVLGLSFLVGGLAGNPGCEVTALPNLVLPRDKQVHFL